MTELTVSKRVAHVVTEVFAPVVLIFGLLFAVAIHATGSVAKGLLLGGIAAFFAGGLPYLILMAGIRSGRLSDRHLRNREERPAMMAIGLASVSVGFALMVWLDAPLDLYALVAAMVAGVVVSLVISTFWKISIHTACAAGTVAVLVVVFGPGALWLTPVVAAIAWSRVTLGDHTIPQVAVGAAIGVLVAGSVMTAMAI